MASEDEELLSALRNGGGGGDYVDAMKTDEVKSKSQTPLISLEDYLDLKTQLAAAEAMVEEMQRQNDNVRNYFSLTYIFCVKFFISGLNFVEASIVGVSRSFDGG